MQRTKKAILYLLLVSPIVSLVPAHAQYNAVERVSVGPAGVQANGSSSTPIISGDGRYVVFSSSATNLVASDTNGFDDIFIYDRQTDTTTRVSVDSDGVQANAASSSPRVSSDGRYVVFVSSATNLVTGDTNNADDVFVYDRQTTDTTRVSIDSTGLQGNAASSSPAMSSDGRYVVFVSAADNLVSGDTNDLADIFIRDRQGNTTVRVNLGPSDVEADSDCVSPSVSDDGRYVVFSSTATNLVTGDTNTFSDVFLRDLQATPATTTRLSVSTAGIQANGSSSAPLISRDGLFVTFESDATNLVTGDTNALTDVFLRDVQGNATTLASISTERGLANGESFNGAVTGTNNRFLAFDSGGTDLVTGDTNGHTDVFALDRNDGSLIRTSVRADGVQLDTDTSGASLSSTAQFMAFQSDSNDLVDSDTNNRTDIFVINLECLLGLSVTPTDTDGDATPDCTDGCGADATKTAPGSCGCGTPDTDTDGDSTADCVDECPSDATKAAAGTCGCGVSDADTNGNGVSDCNDPTANTIPRRLRIQINGKNVKVTIPNDFSGVTNNVTLSKNGRVVSRKTTTSNIVRFKNLKKGTYRLKYTVTLGGVTTQSSETTRVIIK